MRWVRFQHQNETRFGIVEGDQIIPVDGSPFGQYQRLSTSRPLAGALLLPPVIPPTFYAAGANYVGHAKEMAEQLGAAAPKKATKADIGYRANNALIGAEAPIVVPHDSSGKIQYEPELVVVIGKEVKHVAESEALSCVFGYTIGNDISERSWQAADRTLWRAKNADTFKPMGPWIETDVDLESLTTRVRLNGTLVADFPTNQMVFGVARYISEITRYITLYPGDIIWMGADSPTKDMVAGDVVEVEIDGIGVLRNPVIAERDRG
jgi:2-keto-4-pentenoate hydratase/2-oxohepta-3-ene-1,7-dioic acid hydratase in catechol pathway